MLVVLEKENLDLKGESFGKRNYNKQELFILVICIIFIPTKGRACNGNY